MPFILTRKRAPPCESHNSKTDGARFQWLGTDCNNAHVQPTGAYHYHGLPEGLINRLGEGVDGAAIMSRAIAAKCCSYGPSLPVFK